MHNNNVQVTFEDALGRVLKIGDKAARVCLCTSTTYIELVEVVGFTAKSVRVRNVRLAAAGQIRDSIIMSSKLAILSEEGL